MALSKTKLDGDHPDRNPVPGFTVPQPRQLINSFRMRTACIIPRLPCQLLRNLNSVAPGITNEDTDSGSQLYTIDLQDQDSPSAKDHTRQPAHPAPYGDGPPAPHQERALKHAEQEAAVELHHTRSPRVSQDLSGKELQLLQEDGDGHVNPDLILPHHDQQLGQRNGGNLAGAATDADTSDVEGDDGLDDELMDKISSSPSIDEEPIPCTPRYCAKRLHRLPQIITPSSSPFLSTPLHFPITPMQKDQDQDNPSEVHHHQGGYGKNEDENQQTTADDSFSSETRDHVGPMISEQRREQPHNEWEGLSDSYSTDLDPNDIHHLLLPADDPLLDTSFDDADLSTASSISSSGDSTSSDDHCGLVTIKSDVDNANGSDDSDDDSDDDDTKDIFFSNNPRFIDSGWGGECLRDTEDIDFEFVYALHTFIATVEGQANATKGDTMVLLDDSNSYWWLVRVAKDNSIGYLPAEHIETPTERLARLNKHRNIDNTKQTMLDNTEKTRNPLKKAMKRRGGRSVQFAAPTYFEAFDVDYSTEEEEEEGEGEYLPNEEERPEARESDPDARSSEEALAETHQSKSRDINTMSDPQTQNKQSVLGIDNSGDPEKARTSDEMFEYTDDSAINKSRKGTVRNTDSFFKDESTETRKINLTPSLLRDDSSGSTVRSVDAKEVPTSELLESDIMLTRLKLRNRPSIDSIEKTMSSPEKSKDDKKRKEKKGMLSGFFKRKDKKGRGFDDSLEDSEKMSEENSGQSPQPRHPTEASREEGSAPRAATQPQRQTSKLQKSPPSKLSPKPSVDRGASPSIKSVVEEADRANTPQAGRSPPKLNMEFETTPLIAPEPRQPSEPAAELAPVTSIEAPRPEPTEVESPKDSRRGMFSPIRDVLRSSPSASEPKPEKAKKAKHRMPIDDFDSSSDTEDQPESSPTPPEHRSLPIQSTSEPIKERLSESPVQVSPQEQPQQQHPPALMIDTSSQDDPSTSPVSPLSSAEFVEAPDESRTREETPASTGQSSTNTPAWNDAHLRAYLEDGSDIRDLLLVVHNKADVKPAPPDHPLVKNLFKDENRKLGEISTRLDGLLGDWLAKKSKTTPR
ncbi:MAG: hypothetical protein Q9222_006936 [Ikaeria aurantiellina]